MATRQVVVIETGRATKKIQCRFVAKGGMNMNTANTTKAAAAMDIDGMGLCRTEERGGFKRDMFGALRSWDKIHQIRNNTTITVKSGDKQHYNQPSCVKSRECNGQGNNAADGSDGRAFNLAI